MQVRGESVAVTRISARRKGRSIEQEDSESKGEAGKFVWGRRDTCEYERVGLRKEPEHRSIKDIDHMGLVYLLNEMVEKLGNDGVCKKV